MKIDLNTAKILNELQYNFPLTPTPFRDIAYNLGISEDYVLKIVRNLMEHKIIKRIGFTVNYKSQGKVAALVGVKVSSREDIERLRMELLNNQEVTHNYLRDDPDFQVWFTIKAPSFEILKNDVAELLENKLKLSDYVILPSKRVCKVSVRYDLIKGIGWSKPTEQPNDVPKPEEIGIPPTLPREVSRLKPVSRPYLEIAKKYGLSEEELLNIVRLMLEKGILRNPGASVDGDKIGFKYNVMTVLNVDDTEYACKFLKDEVWEASHIVERIVPERWPYPVYFVLHAMKKDVVEEVINNVIRHLKPISYRKLYSIENLKPGVAR
ncbi:hypothetical protein EYM_07875 [Ignicoccus islandicus DSM 13165]|uniref:siroheme decarboxylase n=1 Tax=Ignicoccus islandicus DSM 13165 TaxID=940295 RepID=A0A0U3E4H6_9CREN|nr:Lrp/AsnC family transcriptional regulator [Ignicoccus islandicus]ALU12827.1 hypothetical protein EYM_07875 [Ignicoccus islandicus DSM 13165]